MPRLTVGRIHFGKVGETDAFLILARAGWAHLFKGNAGQ
jgi:hypothetical protein